MASVGLAFRLFCMPADVLENCVLEFAGTVTLDMVLAFAGSYVLCWFCYRKGLCVEDQPEV